MKNIKATCPECGASALIADAWAGARIHCPQCSTEILVQRPTRCPTPLLILGILVILAGLAHLAIQFVGLSKISQRIMLWDIINSEILAGHASFEWVHLFAQFALALALVYVGARLLGRKPRAQRKALICGAAMLFTQVGYRLYLFLWISPYALERIEPALQRRADKGLPSSLEIPWMYMTPSTVSAWWLCFLAVALVLIITPLLPPLAASLRPKTPEA